MIELKQFHRRAIKIDAHDNVAVALVNLEMGDEVVLGGTTYTLRSRVPAKHKFALENLKPDDRIMMYGVLVGQALSPIHQGEAVSTSNTRHRSATFHAKSSSRTW